MSMEKYIILIRIGLKQFEKNEAKKCIQHLTQGWSTKYHRKPGYQYQMEAVFKAYNSGWSKEKIGSHIVRNNIIYDCGQNGIVGHMGCIFSEIYHNHIYNIATKHEFFGYEIAGIKLHAAIDVVIENNYIHDKL